MKVVSRMQVEQVTRVNSSLPTCKHRRKQLDIGDVDIDTSASPTMVVCDKVVEQNMTSFVSRFYVQYGYIAWLNLSSLSRGLSITLSPTHFMGCSYRKVR